MRRCFISLFLLAVMFCIEASSQSICTGDQLFTEQNCVGDAVSDEEKALFQIVNAYRKANGRTELRLSVSLSTLANRRLIDLTANIKMITHSWSNCRYDANDAKTWPCVLDSPKRLNVGYKGQGFETLYHTTSGKAVPADALKAWQKSSLHNSIILNLDILADKTWDEMGVGIDGQYAVLWFGCPEPRGGVETIGETGLGVTYDQAVKGLTGVFSLTEASTAETNAWTGFSADRSLKLEIFGKRADVNEADIAISAKLNDGKLPADAKSAISTLLKNIFPDWQDREAWIENSCSLITENKAEYRTKLIRKAAVTLSRAAEDTIRVTVKPEKKPNYIEVF